MDNEIIIEKLDNFSLLVPDNEISEPENYISNFIDHQFQDGSLLFSIIELTHRFNLNQIGDTTIYANKFEIESILNLYHSIIDQMEELYPDEVISNYESWYKEKPHIIKGSNKIDAKNSVENYIWHSDKPPFKDISTEKLKKFIPKRKREHYLEVYINQLKEKMRFNEFPHFAVIVVPLNVILAEDSSGIKEVKPIGNLYLHFGTNEYKSSKFYCELLNKFYLIWYRIYGKKIFNNFDLINITEKGIEPKYYYLKARGFLKLKTVTEGQNSKPKYIYEIFDRLFGIDEKKQDLISKIEKVYRNSIESFGNRSFIGNPSLFRNLKKIGFRNIHKNKNELNDVSSTLIQREIIKVGILLFRENIGLVHSLVSTKGSSTEVNAVWESLINYFYSERCIVIPSVKEPGYLYKHEKKNTNNIEGYRINGLDESSFQQLLIRDNKVSTNFIKNFEELDRKGYTFNEILSELKQDSIYFKIINYIEKESKTRNRIIKSLCDFEVGLFTNQLKKVISELPQEKEYSKLEICYKLLEKEIVDRDNLI